MYANIDYLRTLANPDKKKLIKIAKIMIAANKFIYFLYCKYSKALTNIG